MDAALIKAIVQYSGLAGLTVGALLLVCRSIVAKNIFPKLTRREAFLLLRLIVVAVWSVSVLAIVLSFLPPKANSAASSGVSVPPDAVGTAAAPAAGGEAKASATEKRDANATASGPLKAHAARTPPRSREAPTSSVIQTTYGDNSPAVANVGGHVTINREPAK